MEEENKQENQFSCNLCNISCTSNKQLEAHLRSKKHKNMLKKTDVERKKNKQKTKYFNYYFKRR